MHANEWPDSLWLPTASAEYSWAFWLTLGNVLPATAYHVFVLMHGLPLLAVLPINQSSWCATLKLSTGQQLIHEDCTHDNQVRGPILRCQEKIRDHLHRDQRDEAKEPQKRVYWGLESWKVEDWMNYFIVCYSNIHQAHSSSRINRFRVQGHKKRNG